jgi:two-component system, chemotaxis family, CheB/CheR fusion protein
MATRKRSAKNKNAGRRRQAQPAIPAVVADSRHHDQGAGVESAPQPLPPRKTSEAFPIVGVGASAGGLEALEDLFRDMPADTGMAFVVVSHLHPGHTSMLPELLGKATKLTVVEAGDGVRVRPNHVYVGPPGSHLAVLNGALHRMEVGSKQVHLPIDYFLRSLATDQKEKGICIILSGTGTDGTLGLKAIKAELGMSMVQQVESAKYAGMPSSAIATGLADFVVPPADMPKQLVAYAKGPYLSARLEKTEEPAAPEPIQKIFVLMRERIGHDFSGYKLSTIKRRIDRRMNLHQLKSPVAYVRYLQDNPHEIDILFKELLIGVTSFFRDAEAFESLKTTLTELLKSRPDNYTLRVWVPGCASGEEVYSLAIVLRECMESLKRRFEVQIFGTDLDSEAIDVARNGQYPDGIAVDVPPKRVVRDFVREGGTYRIRREIREMTVFAVQNVIKDAPFTKLDLVSCRNLLIYLNADVQKRLLPVFHYSLKPGGLLFLGPSETIGSYTDLFEVLDKRWKIFRRKDVTPSIYRVLEFSAAPWRDHREARQVEAAPGVKEANVIGSVERLLLGRFVPASVVVNDRGDALFFHGRTGAYLEPAAGKSRLNIVDMAREGLQLELSAALRQASTHDADAVRHKVHVKTNGDFVDVDLTVGRIKEPESLRGLFLVTFRPAGAPVKPVKGSGRRETRVESSQRAALERELQSAKESLRTTIEELETSNEELKSTNEELQSTNEELQSANEELETSKEEMQSLNEELSTINAELQSKVDDLSRSNDDMQNLLNSIEIATIFLDMQLKITRYTEQARRLVNLIQTDVGRPLADLVSNLDYTGLVPDCREVLRTLVFKQCEVQTREGHWYLLRIIPYRTGENIIDGLVLTFVDINPVKQAETRLRRMSKVFTDGLDPVLIVDLQGRIVDLNEEVVRSYGWTRSDLLNQPVSMMAPPAGRGQLAEWLERCRKGEAIRSVEFRRLDKSGVQRKDLLTLSLLTDEQGAPEAISMTIKLIPG